MSVSMGTGRKVIARHGAPFLPSDLLQSDNYSAINGRIYGLAENDDDVTVDSNGNSAIPSSSGQSVTKNANGSELRMGRPTTALIIETNAHDTAHNLADWGLTIPIMLFFPLLVVKTAETLVPKRSCIQGLAAEWDACQSEGRRNDDVQYFLVLIMGIIGLIVSLVMTRYRISSRPALLGLSYGSMLCLIYAVWTNTQRIDNWFQIAIIGVILIGFIFLPRIGGSLMGSY